MSEYEIERMLDAERGVLGSMILSEEACALVVETLVAADFHRPAHAAVFEAVRRTWARGGTDIVTIKDDLLARGEFDKVGGLDALIGFAEFVPSPKNARFYADIVARDALARRAHAAGLAIARAAQDVDRTRDDWPDRLRAACEAEVAKVGHPGGEDAPLFEDVCARAMARVDAAQEGDATVQGLSTGLPSLDAIMGGLRGSTLTVVGARPGMGKTALALRLVDSVATAGVGVYVASLEMSDADLAHRLSCARAQVGIREARRAMDDDTYNRYAIGMDKVHRLPISIESATGRGGPRAWTMDRVRIGALKARRRFASRIEGGKPVELGLAVIDYFQLLRADIKGHGNNDQLALESMSAAAKALAMELNVAVVLLSQLGRDVEKREDKRPNLGDLRSTGALEQDADVVLFPYRPSYYTAKAKGEPEADLVAAEIIVAKQRDGETGTARTSFEPAIARFEDARGWS